MTKAEKYFEEYKQWTKSQPQEKFETCDSCGSKHKARSVCEYEKSQPTRPSFEGDILSGEIFMNGHDGVVLGIDIEGKREVVQPKEAIAFANWIKETLE